MCSQNWAGSYMPVPTSHIWFGSVIPKKALSTDHIEQNQPGSDLDSLARFWPNASGLEVNWCARIVGPSSGRMHPAHYKFPHFQTWPGSCCAQIRFGSGWVYHVLAKQIQFRSKPVCKNHWAHFRADPGWMRIGCGMFTGTVDDNAHMRSISFGGGLRQSSIMAMLTGVE